MRDVFISASVPEAGSEFAKTADPLMIHAAVRAICLLGLRTHRIVWGGHPAITPMIWAVCENLGESSRERVVLYQSAFFAEKDRPLENSGFADVRLTDRQRDRESSLEFMRKAMFSEHEFSIGIFIGGKEGIVQEFALFREMHPNASVILLPSTGGASKLLAKTFPECSAPTENFTDFVGYLAPFFDSTSPDLAAKSADKRPKSKT